MDGTVTYYAKSTINKCLTTIQYYENIVKRPLNIYELIKFAIKNDNYMLVNFLINKRVNYIAMLIDRNTRKYGKMIITYLNIENVLYYGQALTDQQYTNKLIYYTERTGCNIEDLIEEVSKHKDWVMLTYIYTNEKKRIIEYTRQEDTLYEESLKPKNRKFFILQF